MKSRRHLVDALLKVNSTLPAFKVWEESLYLNEVIRAVVLIFMTEAETFAAVSNDGFFRDIKLFTGYCEMRDKFNVGR
jgi:hypothetical protein